MNAAALAEEVRQASARLGDTVRRTPAVRSRSLEALGLTAAWLKCENLQHTGSFKARGALNRLRAATPEQRSRGVVAASTGNHGAAVAWAGQVTGAPACVFVPEGSDPSKLEGIRSRGAQICVHGADCVETERFARRAAEDAGQLYVSPYNDPLVAAGQGTVAVELLEQAGTLDAVFVAVGGGGLISGIGSWLALRAPRARVIAVSPRNSAVMHASMAAGRLLDLPSLPTLSDATAGGVEAGAITFELCREVVDRSLLVDEEPIAQAIRWMIDSHHMLIEGAAALAVAGLRQLAPELQGARVAVVLCGANIGSARLSKVLCPQGQSAPLS